MRMLSYLLALATNSKGVASRTVVSNSFYWLSQAKRTFRTFNNDLHLSMLLFYGIMNLFSNAWNQGFYPLINHLSNSQAHQLLNLLYHRRLFLRHFLYYFLFFTNLLFLLIVSNFLLLRFGLIFVFFDFRFLLLYFLRLWWYYWRIDDRGSFDRNFNVFLTRIVGGEDVDIIIGCNGDIVSLLVCEGHFYVVGGQIELRLHIGQKDIVDYWLREEFDLLLVIDDELHLYLNDYMHCQNVMSNQQSDHLSPSAPSISIMVLDMASFAQGSSWMWSTMSFITFLMVYQGRLVLWLPLKISRYFLPLYSWQSFYELALSISLSSSPLINTMKVDQSIFFTSYLISSCSMSYLPFSWMSLRSLLNTHGNRQLTTHPGTYLGEFYFAICLHRLLKHRNEESAMIIGAFPNLRAVAAPMLLPQIITLQLFFCRNWTIVQACFDSLTPKLIISSSWFWPQPMKSKEAKEKRQGRYLMMPVDYKREEEFPWRQSMIHCDLCSGSKTVRVIDLSQCFIIVSFRQYLVQFSTNTLEPYSYHAYPMNSTCSSNAEDAGCREVVFATLIILQACRLRFLSAAWPRRGGGQTLVIN